MTTGNNGLTESAQRAFDTERLAWDVDRIGEGLEALARLMQASDPDRTDGHVDTPILHGLGNLVEVVGRQVSEYGKRIAQSADVTFGECLREDSGGLDLRELSKRYGEACKS